MTNSHPNNPHGLVRTSRTELAKWSNRLAERGLQIANCITAPTVDSQDIFTAVTAGDFDGVRAILLVRPGAVNARRQNGATPLHAAAWHANLAITELLLIKGADPNASNEFGATPLFWAAGAGHKPDDAVDVVRGGSDVRRLDSVWRHKPDDAVDVVRVLLASGADAKIGTEFGTALHRAVLCDHNQIVEALIDAGADIHSRDADNWTPLKTAVYNHRAACVATLIKAGVNVNFTGYEVSELHDAAGWGDFTIVKLLLDGGAIVDELDDCGRTALHLAAYMGWADTVRTLLEHGARIDICDHAGNTPLATVLKSADEIEWQTDNTFIGPLDCGYSQPAKHDWYVILELLRAYGAPR